MRTAQMYTAPVFRQQYQSEVVISGSKSMTNRALLLSCLSTSPVRIMNPLASDDTQKMLNALGVLGCIKKGSLENAVTIQQGKSEGPVAIDCGQSGTTMRFLLPLCGLREGETTLIADKNAQHRPMLPLINALTKLGIQIDGDCFPIRIQSRGKIAGGLVQLDASTSSQFISSLLLSGSQFMDELTIMHTGESLPSLPHIDMSIKMLEQCGIPVHTPQSCTWTIHPSPLTSPDWTIEPDLSNAFVFCIAALLTGASIKIPYLSKESYQPITQVLQILAELGAKTEITVNSLTVQGSGLVNGGTYNLHAVSELAPAIIAAVCFANRPSRIIGIEHISTHESDRIAALVHNITEFGGKIFAIPGGVEVHPRPLQGTVWQTYHDHRIATAGCLIGLRVYNTLIEDITTTQKTFPRFRDIWEQMWRNHK